MKQLITLAAALTLAISTSAFANSHKEAPGMAASGAMGGGAMSKCDAQAAEKKLAGAAGQGEESADNRATPRALATARRSGADAPAPRAPSASAARAP